MADSVRRPYLIRELFLWSNLKHGLPARPELADSIRHTIEGGVYFYGVNESETLVERGLGHRPSPRVMKKFVQMHITSGTKSPLPKVMV